MPRSRRSSALSAAGNMTKTIAENNAEFKARGYCLSEAAGVIRYKPPDHGMFRVDKMKLFDLNTNTARRRERQPGALGLRRQGDSRVQARTRRQGWPAHHPRHSRRDAGRSDCRRTGAVHFRRQGRQAAGPLLDARHRLPRPRRRSGPGSKSIPNSNTTRPTFITSTWCSSNDDFSVYALMIELPSRKQRTTFMFNDIVVNDLFPTI